MTFEFDHLFICTDIGASAADRLVAFGLREERITVGTNSDILTEPMLFQTPFAQRPDRFPAHRVQPIAHQVDLREITRVEIVSPNTSDQSTALQAAIDTHCLNIRSGGEYLVELGFDGETQGQKVDFRPDLPLTISW